MFITNEGVINCGYLGHDDDRLFFERPSCYIGIGDSHTFSLQIGGEREYQKVIFIYLSEDKDRSSFKLSEIRIRHFNIVDAPYHFE